MRQIPQKIRKIINENPFYRTCARKFDGHCDGRITMEHAFIYAGKQINEVWAIIPLCWHHHLGKGLRKSKNQWIAINRATQKDFEKYPKKDWKDLKRVLNNIYKYENLPQSNFSNRRGDSNWLRLLGKQSAISGCAGKLFSPATR